MKNLYADVALALPSGGSFQYAVPERSRSLASPGRLVMASVRGRRMLGVITRLSMEKAVDEVRELDALVDAVPPMSAENLELSRRVAEHYFCSQGQVLEAMLPAAFKRGKFSMKSRAAKASDRAEITNPEEFPLTSYQRSAYETVSKRLRARKAGAFLLYGVTGSGKTEVYLHCVRDLLREGRGSIILVPEISLTPQAVDRFHSRFGDKLAVIHSRLAQGRRVDEWKRIRSGEAKVVVGARSAVFSPVQDLGLIVLDEEHDTSYKQEETPRYHAREVARLRAEIEGAVVVMGGATPSLETFHDCDENGATVRVELPERIEKRPLPAVEIIDMRRMPDAKPRLFSPRLEDAVRETLAKKEQVMLLLNRRGYSTYLHCPSCGYVMTCENCRISLAYHFDKGVLLCHACGFKSATVRLCPGCKKNYLHYFGSGTQKVEMEASKLFPEARVARMDSDSTSRKDSHETILRSFKRGEIDVLIGTQMIAKGHDFPNVSLIGVISADTVLHVPDFRAAERTFALMTQVAGRAGRGDVPGRVLVQTFVPHHYSIQSAKEHDYAEFYAKEIEFRRELGMPPFSRLALVTVGGRVEKEVVRQAIELSRTVEAAMDRTRLRLLGPAPSLVSKREGEFFWNFFVKGPSVPDLLGLLRPALASFKKTRVTITVDIDPQ